MKSATITIKRHPIEHQPQEFDVVVTCDGSTLSYWAKDRLDLNTKVSQALYDLDTYWK